VKNPSKNASPPQNRAHELRAELGAKLGVSDIDGSAPKSYRYELGGPPELHATLTS
jgi:hypothetical protein